MWDWPPAKYKLDGEEHDCDCEWQDRLRDHYLLAGIPLHYWSLGEGDFHGDQQALGAAQEYLREWDDWKRYGVGLQFYSPTQGTGKTMLACLIAKELIKRKVKVQFISFGEAVRLFERPYEERRDIEQRLRHIPVLILDEVSKAYTSAQRDFFASQLETLIRFRSDGNGVTIITTNMTPEELDFDYPRTFSLLASKQEYVHVQGGDYRKESNWDEYHKHLIKHGEALPIT